MKCMGYMLFFTVHCVSLWGSEQLLFFHKALQHEDESLALHVLCNGFPTRLCTPAGETQLMSAAWRNRAQVVQKLIEYGVDLDAQTHYGDTALMGAAKNGHTAVAKILINAGADIHVQNKTGFSALLWAVRKNHMGIVTMLMEAGVHVNAYAISLRMPIMYAFPLEEDDMLVYLLRHGADPVVSQTGENYNMQYDLNSYMRYVAERAACVIDVLEQVHNVPRDLTRLMWVMADCPMSHIPAPAYGQS